MTLARSLTIATLALGLSSPTLAQTSTYLAGVVQTPTEHVAPVQVVARFDLPRMSGGVNDFSDIHSRDGTSVLMLSDQGFIVAARLQRDWRQQITGIDIRQISVLTDETGTALGSARRHAEDLAVAHDGSIYVAFAEYNRVARYRRLGAPAEALVPHEDFGRLPSGRGLESLAIAPDGTVHAIPESAARATYGYPSYRWMRDGVDGSFRLPSEGPFHPVAADFGPDGLLYVLERSNDGGGIRSQVRRARINGRAISTPQVVMRSEPGQFGNLEGLSVWRDWNGRIRLLMVSDDERGSRSSEVIEVVLNR